MDAKSRSHTARAAAVSPASAPKRGRVVVETARLFLDVDEIIRRSQTQRVSLSRYVE